MGKRIVISPNTQEQSSSFASLEVDLSVDKPEGILAMDVKCLSFASITVQTAGTTCSGTLEIKQGNTPNNLFSLSTPVILTLGSNVLIGAFDIPISGAFIGIDRSKAVWGNTGRLIININAKQNGGSDQPYITSQSGGTVSTISYLESDGVLSINDDITTGGVILANTCIWCKIENISPSVVANITTATDNIALQPGESFYEEMQLLDKIYRQARIEYNPNAGGLLRITKKLRT